MTSQSASSPAQYPSDLSDEEWSILQSLLEEFDPYTIGRRRKSDLREILNAIFYLNKTGCPWRYLPRNFPDYRLVNYYYNKWTHNAMLERINAALRQFLREKRGRSPDPTAAIIDSQSVKGTPESAIDSGFDGGKLVKGRKRHIVVDTMGCVLAVWISAANMFDGKAAYRVLSLLFIQLDSIKKIWADSAYRGAELSNWVCCALDCVLEVVKKWHNTRGFAVLPKRWIVERTFAWLGRSRRLSRDYERNPASSGTQVYFASVRLLLRQITDNQIPYKAALT
jgi:putative transposase